MDNKFRKESLKKYLGFGAVWFDTRKKEIFNDGIDIKQWMDNMNYLIYTFGPIDESERRAFEEWEYINEVNYLEIEEIASPVLRKVDGNDVMRLPPFLYKGTDRNWFLAAYPDVVDYFYPMIDYKKDLDSEQIRVDAESDKIDHNRLTLLLSQKPVNQTIMLIRLKNHYRDLTGNEFLLEC